MSRPENEPPETTSANDAGRQSGGRAPVDRSRRRLAGAGISASVLMTLSSRSALASHCTVSGMLSGNLSSPDADVSCRDKTPGFWKTHPESSPAYTPGPCNPISYTGGECSDYTEPTSLELVNAISDGVLTELEVDTYNATPRGTRFSTVFGPGIAASPTLTLMQALWMEDPSRPPALVAHCVAAVMNAIEFGPEAFGYSVEGVVALVHAGIGSPSTLTSQLTMLNERG